MKELILKSTAWRIQSPFLAGQIAIWSFVLIGSLTTSFIMHYSSLQIASSLPNIALGINGGGLFLGGFIAGRKAGRRGWFFGGCQGIIHAVILPTISFLALDQGMEISPFLFFIFSIGISAIGGILGMNTNKG